MSGKDCSKIKEAIDDYGHYEVIAHHQHEDGIATQYMRISRDNGEYVGIGSKGPWGRESEDRYREVRLHRLVDRMNEDGWDVLEEW